MEIKLHVTREKLDGLNVGKSVTYENPAEASWRELRELVIEFMVDERDEPIPAKRARSMLDSLSKEQLVDTVIKIFKSTDEIAVNPTPAVG